MKTWRRLPAAGVCVLAAFALTVPDGPAQPKKRAWKDVGDWFEPTPPALRGKMADRIRTLSGAVQIKGDDHIGYKAIKALALLQALPFLRAEGGKGERSHADAKNQVKLLFKDVAAVVYPEYSPELAGEGPALPNATLTVLGLRERLMKPAREGGVDGGVNYAVPFVLLLSEMVASGGLAVGPEGSDGSAGDRAARPFFKPASPALRLGIARLATLLLASGQDDVLDAPVEKGVLWTYGSFSRTISCLSKSSTVLFGLAAAANLGIGDYDDKDFAFKFHPTVGGNLTAAAFKNRLNDVLWHCVFSLTELPAPAAGSFPESAHLGIAGLDVLKRAVATPDKDHASPPAPTQGLDLKALEDQPVDVTRYRVLYATRPDEDRRPRAVMRIQFSPDIPPLEQPYAFYRYHPCYGGYKGYHTASAAFILCTAMRLLGMRLDELPFGATLGTRYQVARAEKGKDRWTLKAAPDGGRAFEITPDLGRKYTQRKVVEPATGQELPVELRVGQALNAAVAMLTRREVPARKEEARRRLARGMPPAGAKAGETQAWHSALTLAGYERTFAGMCVYGILKTALGTHRDHHYALGPWVWWHDVAEDLIATDYANTSGNTELILATLARAFRPTFPRPAD